MQRGWRGGLRLLGRLWPERIAVDAAAEVAAGIVIGDETETETGIGVAVVGAEIAIEIGTEIGTEIAIVTGAENAIEIGTEMWQAGRSSRLVCLGRLSSLSSDRTAPVSKISAESTSAESLSIVTSS
jgi:hypothetical protein